MFDRLKKRRDLSAESQRNIERSIKRQERKKRRRERLTFIFGLVGHAAGVMFGSKKIGWAIVAVLVTVCFYVVKKLWL